MCPVTLSKSIRRAARSKIECRIYGKELTNVLRKEEEP
jgi:hypothetical protein